MTEKKHLVLEERIAKTRSGLGALFLNLLAMLLAAAFLAWSISRLSNQFSALWVTVLILSLVYLCLVGPIFFGGLKVLKPNEAYVLTLFGTYIGTLKGPGFYFVNPFATAFNPGYNPFSMAVSENGISLSTSSATEAKSKALHAHSKRISLKAMTLNNEKQKINDQLGNPIIIGIVVIWRVINTAKAVFNVDNYMEYLSIQCDSALRDIVRQYPYDVSNDDLGNEKTLRGSSQEIASKLKAEIQKKAELAGLEILEARITHLSYAPEIASAMLQRQQASAIIDARQMIVDGAVGMVEMALTKLNENDVVHLDEERKAAMVSNLLVVLCGNRDAQPIVNSGSLY